MSWCHVHGSKPNPGCPECWEPEAPVVPRTSHLGDPLQGSKADAGYPPHAAYTGPPWIVINPVTGQMWPIPSTQETPAE